MVDGSQVALLVDFENLLLSVRDQFGEPVQWQRVIRVAEQQGRVVVRRVYADWSACGPQQKDLQSLSSVDYRSGLPVNPAAPGRLSERLERETAQLLPGAPPGGPAVRGP